MKVLLYFENAELIKQSGIGRAMRLQQEALADRAVSVTTDPKCDDYDILHINTYGIKSYFMVKKAHKMGKKVIYHAHSTYEDFKNSFLASNLLAPFYKKYLQLLYGSADALITPTPYSRQLVASYGIQAPIYPISNGIRLAQYGANPAHVQAFRDYFHLKPGQRVVMSVGLFFERKGIFDFVALAEAHPDVTFIWFGHTNLAIIPEKVRRVVKGKHPKNVHFPGYISGDVILGAFADADLFCYPSYEETEGIVVLEALASKQALLVRDIPVYDPWLKDGVNAYKAHDLADFDRQLTAILAGQVPDLTEAGYAVAKARDLSVVGADLERVYRAVLAGQVLDQGALASSSDGQGALPQSTEGAGHE
ncbi:glycosyltransferase [Leuconostocaceae bacterium ESL0958]|nr:glycosyltransferase [Leuconostocaceae bacterium ESL0958]